MSAKNRPATTTANPYRGLPSVNELVDAPQLAAWRDSLPRAVVVSAARDELDACRREIAAANGHAPVTLASLADRISTRLDRAQRPALDEVINGTGILIHTGLGRAPLAESALRAIERAAAGYTALEIDLETGGRGKRVDAVRNQLATLCGAESATVVNNNAAALVITLSTLAAGRQVVVSRGELIEIGGSFRLPEVMAASGARLCEVGTTNKSRVQDYSSAMSDETGALLKVHPSNYRLVGFTDEVSIDQLARLGRQHNVPVIHDVGSGAVFEMAGFGLGDEPVARASIEAGADLVLFSGDKLLGGPQAGVIAGRRELVERIERNPLMRALRVDKLTLAALSATLTVLAHPEQAASELPLWRLIATPVERLRARAEQVAQSVKARAADASVEVHKTTAYVGGGSLPDHGVESVAVAIHSRQVSDQQLADRLRTAAVPVMGRLQNGRLLVDLRAVFPRQDQQLTDALIAALGG